ncbi:MAG TPA: 4Fe-4S binding protein [bacterium]|nr:4Fe-4S binding protein [bacterium]
MNAVATKEAPKKKGKKVKGPPQIVVNTAFCKGCGICVEFCPKSVLAMKGAKAVVIALEECIECMFCELRCPDFAIAVYPAEG